MINVGQIRQAIKGLPDAALVKLQVENNPDPYIDVEFVGVSGADEISNTQLTISCTITPG